MAVLKLTLDDFFEDETFSVIAIHCDLEQYRLAYLINKQIKIALYRSKKDIEQNENLSAFELFEFHDDINESTLYLVSNISKNGKAGKPKKKAIVTDLFSNEINENQTTNYLIPELKKVAYFLKIEAEFSENDLQIIINKILEIPQVITAYYADVSGLKSKNNLIFN